MNKEYTPLETHKLENCIDYAHSHDLPVVIRLNDPALDGMIDFQMHQPLCFEPETLMIDARQEMERLGETIALVVSDLDCLLGFITMEYILGTQPVRLQESLRISSKGLKLKHIILKIAELDAVDFAMVKKVKVGHIIETMHALGEHFLLVSEKNEEGQLIVRGLFTDLQLSRQLGMNIRSFPKNMSLPTIQRLLKN